MNLIYGPVNSRRFGKSLGISIVEQKICNFDCIYCELGISKTVDYEYREYCKTETVIEQLNVFMNDFKERIDVFTITGFGEPTLNSNIDKIAKSIKEKYPQYPLLLLTNSTHLDKKEVIQSFKYFDRIVPSLDAVTETVFQKINKPKFGITAKQIIDNIFGLKQNFAGSIEIEILFCEGVNDSSDEINRLLDCCKKIGPDKIWINTVDRNPAYSYALPISKMAEQKIKLLFESTIVIKEY